jgi:hypothetical protein
MSKHWLTVRTGSGNKRSPGFSTYTLTRLIEEYPFLSRTIDRRVLEHEMDKLCARIFLLVITFAQPTKKLKKMKLTGEAQSTEAGYRSDLGKLTTFLGIDNNGGGKIRLEPVDKYELQELVREGKIGNTSLDADDYLASLGRLAELLNEAPIIA